MSLSPQYETHWLRVSGELREIFKFWSFLQSETVNLPILYRSFAHGPHVGGQTHWAYNPPQMKTTDATAAQMVQLSPGEPHPHTPM